ncbi:RDD family protein [Rubritalea tangerina]|uniref:RDD family protein n=1 Tax=Rubritalea tangerina TaxID=430798 RepID=A0ABW4ZCM5_9BACT
MKVWLLVDGEKSGPHESFEVRERITAGELHAETLAWHQGAEGWLPLAEIPQFSTLFEVEEAEDEGPPPLPEEKPSEVLKKVLAEELSKAPPLHMTRRLFARFHDCLLYLSAVVVIFQDQYVEIFQGESMLPLLAIGICYVLLDGIMVHVWKASPGKFLLGMRTADAQGHAIPLKFSILRSLRVWILGLGMWVMMPLALIISSFMAKRFGYFLWDMPKRYRTVVRPFSGMHVIAYVASIFLMNAAVSLLLPAEVLEQMVNQHPLGEWLKGAK